MNVGLRIADPKEKQQVFVKIASSSCKEFFVYVRVMLECTGPDSHVTVICGSQRDEETTKRPKIRFTEGCEELAL